MLWQDAVDYCFKTRKSWKGKERLQPGINTRNFTDYYGATSPCNEITRKTFKGFCDYLLDMKELADATLNRKMSAVHTVLKHAVQEEELDMNLPTIPSYKEYAGRPFFFNKEDIELICAHTNKTGLPELVRFAALTGARRGECLKVAVRDIDLDNNLIYIGGRPKFNTKTGDWRTVPIHTTLRPMLEQRCDGIPKDVSIFGDQWTADGSVLHYFKKAVRDSGLESYMVFHCLRHSFATWAIEDGVPIRVLMDLMGHKKIETTLRYAKVTDNARKEAISSINF
jgi:integrase